MEKDLDQILEEDFGESSYEYSVYGGGYGISFQHPLYEEYRNKIDKNLVIFEKEYSEKELQDILDTLKKSLENKKDFYTNAKPYMQEKMEEYNKLLAEGILY